MRPGFWPWSVPIVVWKNRFYATVDGDCYNFLDGSYMQNTSLAFKKFLDTKIQAQDEERYIKLMERSRRI